MAEAVNMKTRNGEFYGYQARIRDSYLRSPCRHRKAHGDHSQNGTAAGQRKHGAFACEKEAGASGGRPTRNGQ